MRKLPRAAYWAIGGTVSVIGAAAARLIADAVPTDFRIYIWMVGLVAVFGGLWILSLGTRANLERRDERDT